MLTHISSVSCPACGYEALYAKPVAASAVLGKKTVCPKCRTMFVVSEAVVKSPPDTPAPAHDAASGTMVLQMQHPYLAIFPKEAAPYAQMLGLGESLIGRASAGKNPDIALQDSTVSGRHAYLNVLRRSASELHVLLRDNQSTNGTWLMGKRRIEAPEEFYVRDRQYFQVGYTICALFFLPQKADDMALQAHLAKLKKPDLAY